MKTLRVILTVVVALIVLSSNSGAHQRVWAQSSSEQLAQSFNLVKDCQPPLQFSLSADIAYVGNDGNLWTMAADGTAKRATTQGGGYSEPEWSPDGSQIAAVSTASGRNPQFRSRHQTFQTPYVPLPTCHTPVEFGTVSGSLVCLQGPYLYYFVGCHM